MLLHEFYYWSADQEMAQRIMSAKGLGDARLGCVFGACVKVACFFLSVVPGWTARILYEQCQVNQNEPLRSKWCRIGSAIGGYYDLRNERDANHAYPLLVMREFAPGFKGVMIAGFLAAIMSNLSAAINSLATILTYDVFNEFMPHWGKVG